MPAHSKFTAENREKVLQALKVGASRATAAGLAGIDEATLRRWLMQGKDASEGTRFREFYLEVVEAEAHPRVRALGIIYKEMPDHPELAWKFVERREKGYAPPMPQAALGPAGPVVIQLSLSDGSPLAHAATVIEVQGAENEAAAKALPDPAPRPTG